MAKPAYTSTAMWNFWLRFKKKQPKVKLGGTFAPKPGYHNYRNALPKGDYSVEHAADKLGPGNISGAIDLTLPAAEMKLYSGRLLKSGRDMNDPRGNYLREFYGTVNGYQVTGWDFQAVTYSSSDSSHLWHIHVSVLRKYADDPRAYDALYSILVGESVAAYKLRTGITKVVNKVLPKKYVKAVAGDTLTKIAARNKLSLAKLLSLNPQKKKNPNALNVGEKIRVR